MGIIDLKTNLKSLKYKSGEKPFVTKDIENPPSSSRIGLEATRRLDDVSRVSQVMLPTNSRFIENQARLEQINLSTKIDSIKVAQGKTTAGAIIQQVKNTAVTVSKVIASTIAQTGVAGTGTHFVRGFESADRKTYANEALANGKITFPTYNPKTELIPGKSDYGAVNTPYSIKNAYNITDQDSITSTYSTLIVKDPESKGQLNLSPARITQDLITVSDPEGKVKTPSELKVVIEDGDLARKSFTVGEKPNDKPILEKELDLKIRDFRQGRTDVISFNYSDSTVNKEKRVGLGNKGYWKKPVDYTQTRAEAIDRVNATDVTFDKLDGTDTDESVVKDFIKFRFEVLAPGQKPVFLHFRAFLESLTDNYGGNWNTTSYVGRGDALRNYEGFTRDVSIGFKIVATTRAEMQPLYKKMVYLASATAPTYDSNALFMKGTIVKLTLGSYLYEVPGTLDSVSYTWREAYPWEIALQNPDLEIVDDMQELPHMMDCSIKFTPIHNFVPQTGLRHYITAPNTVGTAKPFF
jgi:hypothetical protein